MVNRIFFSLVSLASLSSFGMEMTKIDKVKTPVKNIELFHNDEGFFVKKHEMLHKAVSVQGEQKLNSKQLKSIIKQGGCFNVEDIGNNNYRVNHKAALKGSGAVLAYWTYGIVKGGLISIGVAGASAAIVGTGGVAGLVTSVGVTGATLGASTGVTLAASAITGVGLTATAGTTTAAAITAAVGTSAGGSGPLILLSCAIESIALGAAALAAMVPGI